MRRRRSARLAGVPARPVPAAVIVAWSALRSPGGAMADIGGQARGDAYPYKGGGALNAAGEGGRKARPGSAALRSSGRAPNDSSFGYFANAGSLFMPTALSHAQPGPPVP